MEFIASKFVKSNRKHTPLQSSTICAFHENGMHSSIFQAA